MLIVRELQISWLYPAFIISGIVIGSMWDKLGGDVGRDCTMQGMTTVLRTKYKIEILGYLQD